MTNYDNQQIERSRKLYLKKYWKISHKHCLMIKHNIDNKHLFNVIDSIHGSFKKSIKSHKLEYMDNTMWIELMNTREKSDLQKMKNCIYKLHLTNVYNLSKTF
jgi:hypothetical protein